MALSRRADWLTTAQLRPVRVRTAPIQVRIAGDFGRLLNISATGALVRVQQALTPERECPMAIHVKPDPFELQVRVVRSTAVSVQVPGEPWQQEFAGALAFTDLSPQAREAVKELCGQAFEKHE